MIQDDIQGNMHQKYKNHLLFLNKKLDGMLLTRFSIDKEVVKQASKGDIISFSRNNLVIEVGTIVNKTSDYLLNEDIGSKIKINKLIPLIMFGSFYIR